MKIFKTEVTYHATTHSHTRARAKPTIPEQTPTVQLPEAEQSTPQPTQQPTQNTQEEAEENSNI